METIDNGKKLSLIIPYYQTYELTKKLLMQLLIQINNTDVEIILVDDGCNEKRFEEYIEWLDSLGFTYGHFVKVIHQENSGVSKARNVGIKEAKGKYIAFIDSDDMVMPNYVDTLLKLIDNQDEDIIYFNWMDINNNSIVVRPSNPAVWKAIYKKDIIPLFDENTKVKEDYFWQQELKEETHSRYYYDKVLYIYNSGRENSLTWKNERGEI